MSLAMLANTSHFAARGLSFPVAVVVTWWLNRLWTFSYSDKAKPIRQLKKYFALQIAGALANFFLFIAILEVIAPTWQNAFLALSIGAVAGLVINFSGSKLLIYRK